MCFDLSSQEFAAEPPQHIDVPKKSSRRIQSSNRDDPRTVLQVLRMHRYKQQTTGYLIYS